MFLSQSLELFMGYLVLLLARLLPTGPWRLVAGTQRRDVCPRGPGAEDRREHPAAGRSKGDGKET